MRRISLVLLILFVVALGSVTAQKLIAGTDFLGWGFDARERDPQTNLLDVFMALKPGLFNYTYGTVPKVYRYPIAGAEEYLVPEEIIVRTVGKSATTTRLFRTSDEERIALDLQVSCKVAVPKIEAEIYGGIRFVLGDQTERRIVSSIITTDLFQLYLKRRTARLNDELVEDFRTLGTKSFQVNDINTHKAYLDIINIYGTHFVDSVQLGGSLKQRTMVDNVSDGLELAITAGIKGSIDASTGSGNTTSGLKISGSLNITFEYIDQFLQVNSVAESEIEGGDPEFADFVLGGADAAAVELFRSWKASLIKNPVATRFRLIEIWHLVPDPIQKEQMCKAVQMILGHPANKIDTICKGVGERIAGSTRLPDDRWLDLIGFKKANQNNFMKG